MTIDQERALRLIRLCSTGQGFACTNAFRALWDASDRPYMRHIESLEMAGLIRIEDSSKIFIN